MKKSTWIKVLLLVALMLLFSLKAYLQKLSLGHEQSCPFFILSSVQASFNHYLTDRNLD